jgi:AcrR family transcriptional regulator
VVVRANAAPVNRVAEPTSPGRRLSKEARREQLLDTAAVLLLRGGIDALTMEGLGVEAGASKTLGYAYFPNIEAVVLALRERELGLLYKRIERAASASESFEERFASAFHAYFDVVAARGVLLGELEQAVRARRLDPGSADGTDAFLRWWAGLIDDEFGCGRRRARGYAAIAAGLANAHATIWKPGRFSRRHIEGTAIAYALGGLRAAVAHDDALCSG